ncbi:hypothetical protein Ait01nite_024950 [Actinoplanes italicus]|uniref:Phosphohistidine phosphatase SixA n=1 Tax=Actinoplanes italicus TaxID=113567 RepID=A0A2T0KFI7_9ACTN|nr:histidine phosphatase family protein [Actinoplanes italicus]PRX22133.1 phosphohistidine phosphatase SixA [Actinoplanes italicus]GIE29450.1 hypothetical protein Ait01nite_024950 [Actinoplanes italicus]
MTLDLVLVRHGSRDRANEKSGLNTRGQRQMESLVTALSRRDIRPTAIVSSSKKHAVESAEKLSRGLLQEPLKVRNLDSLTPQSETPSDLDTFLKELGGDDVPGEQTIVVVGHEGRLSDLLTELIGVRSRPFVAGGAVHVTSSGKAALLRGKGQVAYRYPTVDHQEDAIRTKAHSKMTVSVFLAGFVFTSLNFLLLEAEERSWDLVIATGALTGSLVLFIACVYIFDQLGTPAGFATDGEKPRRWWKWWYDRRARKAEEKWEELTKEMNENTADHDARVRARAERDKLFARDERDGPVYWQMVRTSRYVFTPAVFLALLGYASVVIGTGSVRLQLVAGAFLLTAILYAASRRPNLGAD